MISTKPSGMVAPPTMSRERAVSPFWARVRRPRTDAARRRWRLSEASRSSSWISAVVAVIGAPVGRSCRAAEVGGGHLVGDVLRLANTGDLAVDHDGGVVGDGKG